LKNNIDSDWFGELGGWFGFGFGLV